MRCFRVDKRGLSPSPCDAFESRQGVGLILGKISVDDFQDPFGRISLCRHDEADGLEIVCHVGSLAAVAKLAFRQQADAIEYIKCLC